MHLIVPPNQFTLLQGADVLTTYAFNTGTAQHTFCRVCGIHPFYRPRSYPGEIDINVRCLDGNLLEEFWITPFDGINWEQSVHLIRSDSGPY